MLFEFIFKHSNKILVGSCFNFQTLLVVGMISLMRGVGSFGQGLANGAPGQWTGEGMHTGYLSSIFGGEVGTQKMGAWGEGGTQGTGRGQK